MEGEKNVLVDCFSRLPCMSNPPVGKNEIKKKGTHIDFKIMKILRDKDDVFYADEFLDLLSSICDNEVTSMIYRNWTAYNVHELQMSQQLWCEQYKYTGMSYGKLSP